MSATSTSEIKVVGKSGQISLGKRYAGKTLELQRLDDGSLLLKAVAMVPESTASNFGHDTAACAWVESIYGGRQ